MPRSRTKTSLPARVVSPILASLRRANAAAARRWPGEPQGRQPVHTVYGGAHLFRANTARRLGDLALAAVREYAPAGAALAEAVDLDAYGAGSLADVIHARVTAKLQQEPVEDFRIDFEDGYGLRVDAEEDAHALMAANEVATGLALGTLPPFIGIRIKPLSRELHQRSLRTLDLFVSTVVQQTGGRLPPRFIVTLPKVTIPAQVAAAARACGALERTLRLPARSIALEVMIETPQSIIGADGSLALRPIVAAGRGRVSGAHFGAYDYTALLGVTAAWQSLRHPACDFARHAMQAALAQTGVRLSDSVTTTLPVPRHRSKDGERLTEAQHAENRAAVHRAWKRHFDDVSQSLANGFYQGWDVHPAQLPTRYAAVYTFFLNARRAATVRLRTFVEQATRATLIGDLFDDAATGQGLLNFFARGLDSGALTPEEACETGLTAQELRDRSFLAILRSPR